MIPSFFKNYFVIDNVLSNPYELVSKASSINYYTNEIDPFLDFNLSQTNKPPGIWRGYRSEQLSLVDNDLFLSAHSEIMEKVFGLKNFQYNISSFLHRGDSSINCQNLWHVDKSSLFAFVLYLNYDPPANSGTLLKINEEILPIQNRFNRLVVYNSAIEHRVENFFGSTFEDSRLTLTSFIHGFCVSN